MKKQIFVIFAFALLISGCSVSNWNIGKDTGANTKQPQTQPVQEVKQPQTNQNNFHIDTVINTWGKPNATRVNSAGNKVYVWENCKPTGVMVDKCNENGCSTIPETSCCERALITDQDGYVQNLKEAVNSCI